MFQETKGFIALRNSVLVVLIFFTVFPIVFMFVSTFKQPIEMFKFPPQILFRPSLQNFQILFSEWGVFFRALGNSLIVTVSSSVTALLFGVPAGYALSRYNLKFLKKSGFFMLAVRMYPPIVLTVPLFPWFAKLGLIDTYVGLIALYCTLHISLSSWLMKIYIDEIPIEIEEAASIDGTNFFQKMILIVIPLSMQGIITTTVFVSVFAWKEYMMASIFTSTKVTTSPLILAQMISPETGVNWGPLFAAATVQLVPLIAIIWLAQGYIIKGFSGSIKG